MYHGKLKFKENKVLELDTEYVCWLRRTNSKVGGRKGIWEREVRLFSNYQFKPVSESIASNNVM